MPGVMETVSTLNSFVRTVLAVIVVGGLCVAAWFAYTTYYAGDLAMREKDAALVEAREQLLQQRGLLDKKERELSIKARELAARDATISEQETEIDTLGKTLQEKEEEIQQLGAAIRLLKVDHRLAQISVLDQGKAADTGKLFTKIEFIELDDEGRKIDQPKVFTLDGDMVYVDYWVAKFDDEYVQRADLLRGTSICLFSRIFGEFQEPSQGFQIDEIGSRPNAYARGGKMSDFEKKIWDDFWNIANNPDQARQLGVRAAHGEAVSTRLRKGKTYRLLLRASGGLAITPAEPNSPARDGPSA